MTAKDILERAAEYIGVSVDFTASGEKQTSFLSCLGYILKELSTQYEQLKQEETVTSADGKIPFSAFGKKIVHIHSVKKNGKKIGFSTFPSYVKVGESGEMTATYSYCLETPTINEAIVLPPKYTEEVLALGVASEYLHRTGYEEDAHYYGNRYFTALKNLSVSRKDIVLPGRRYL